ncbi:hypothetical protein BH10CYA1_BH10CYA1_40580 [soil metagenome]
MKARANRAFDQMKAVINYGKRKDLVHCDNPCIGVDKLPTRSRERFIQPGNEFAAFAKALAEEPNELWRDFFWISLLVGARRANVLAMAWNEISFELETWTIPETPQHNIIAPDAYREESAIPTPHHCPRCVSRQHLGKHAARLIVAKPAQPKSSITTGQHNRH